MKMTDRGTTPSTMTDIDDVAALVDIQPSSTVSRTVLTADGARLVLFAFDAGEQLSEHTAAMPVILQALQGHLRITADGRTVDLRPGGVIHLDNRLPHAVDAVEPSKLALLMLDPR